MVHPPIGVGIVGANPDRSWAALSHVPAIHASRDFRLSAVATTRAASAHLARERFDADFAFTDAVSLANHPAVDLVVVTVKVPAHVEVVTAAIDAGKHVYCEWPLTRTADEAEALSSAARAAGIHAVVGLQARFSPAVTRARTMLTEGRIGTVRSASIYSARSKGNTREVPAWAAYTYNANDRASLVEVGGGHALDLVQYLLGPIKHFTARTALRDPVHSVAETGETIHVTAADHLVGVAELDSGAIVSIHVHESEAVLPRTRVEIMGSVGDLALVSAGETDPWASQLQIGRLELHHATPHDPTWRPVSLKRDEYDALPIEAANVARLYHLLAADLHAGTHEAPGFLTAHRLHRLIELAEPVDQP